MTQTIYTSPISHLNVGSLFIALTNRTDAQYFLPFSSQRQRNTFGANHSSVSGISKGHFRRKTPPPPPHSSWRPTPPPSNVRPFFARPLILNSLPASMRSIDQASPRCARRWQLRRLVKDGHLLEKRENKRKDETTWSRKKVQSS